MKGVYFFMEIALNKDEYRYLKKSCETSVEECVEAELSLPEYMPEILRIVKSVAEVSVTGVRCVGERVTVDGSCTLRMLYTSPDGGLYSESRQCAFSRYVQKDELLNAEDVSVRAVVSYVNCRATSQKRAEIKAGIRLNITAFSAQKQNVMSLYEAGAVEEKCVPVSAASLGLKKSKMFSMSETLPVENGSAAFIVSTFSSATLTEIKKIGNKIMLRGDAAVEIAFVYSEDKTRIEHVRHTLPISQILEFEGMEERFTGDVILSVVSCEVGIKNDSEGDGRAFDIALSLNAAITMFEQKELFVITDAYSVKGKTELTKESLRFFSACDEVRDTYTLKATVDASNTGVSAVLDGVGEVGEPVLSCDGEELVISGSLKASFIIRDGAGEITSFEKMLDYKYTKKLAAECKRPVFFSGVTLLSFDCSCKYAALIDVRAELNISCTLFDEVPVEGVSSINVDNTAEKPIESAVTVYFPKENEQLWDIARRYNTTVTAICEENSLEDDTLLGKSILFIPTV